jgi:hypothetical protein
VPKLWTLFAVGIAGLLLSVGAGALFERTHTLSPNLAVACVGLLLSLLAVLLFRIYPYPVFPGPTTSTTTGLQRYLRWLIRDVADYRFMLGTALPDRAKGVVFSELFCDVNSYGFNHRRLSLSRWLNETKVGKERYGAILLGAPGSGKSVTLQAILLSCANSAYLSNILPLPFIGEWANSQFAYLKREPTTIFRLLFDSTWSVPAPPLIPVLVKLGSQEHYFDRYAQKNDPDIERDLFTPIIGNLPELGGEGFRILMESGRLALLFDGLDELTSEAARVNALELVNFIWSRFGDHPNLLLVTCRTGSFSSQLRDAKPRGLGEIALESLTAEDKRSIVTKLIEAELHGVSGHTKSLLSGIDERFKTLAASDGNLKTYRLHREDLVNDLVGEIVDRVPQEYTSWKPADYPLSLRRMTTVLLARPREHLHFSWEPGDERPHWRLDVGHFRDSVLDYTNIIEEDLRELINRRSLFAEENGFPRDEMLRLYGEVAYSLTAGSDPIQEQALRSFVVENTSSTKLSPEESFQAFCAPGIISEVDSQGPTKRYAFRDVESADFLASYYMVNSGDPEGKIDSYISRDDEYVSSSPACITMAFSRLKGEGLREYVKKTKFFSSPSVLTSLVAGVVGSPSFGAISERESDILLKRSLTEVAAGKRIETHFRPWQLIRHIFFVRRYCPDWAWSANLGILNDPAVACEDKAQMLLVAAELSKLTGETSRVAQAMQRIQMLLDSQNHLVVACAALAADYLGSAQGHLDISPDALWASASAGNYALGDPLIRDNPRRLHYANSFRMARFPVLRYQLNNFKDGQKASPGDAFKPAVGLPVEEASNFAYSLGARIPSSAEFEIIAAYHGGKGERRTFPWGDEFSASQLDVALERVSLRALLHESDEASPVAMKPVLSTPGSVFDLVSNVWQLTNDRSPLEYEEPEIIVFGPPLSCDDLDLFRCVDRSPIPAQRLSKRVGFRLARD